MIRIDRLAFALSAAILAAALPCSARAANFDDWPTKYSFADGTEISGTANVAYDVVDFSGDNGY
ncbi:MAG: porin, partial [Lysobacter sp.]|nr:porin [Lysobacter sp.]